MATDRYSLQLDTTQAVNALNSFKNTVISAGAAFASAFAISEIAKVSSQFEDLRTTLGILYKDTETGAKAFDQIKKFAAGSVLQVDQLTETVIKLKAAGLEPTIDQLQLFSDVSAVSADSVGTLQAITDLFARTTEGGLGLEDLNRLADRGIPVFKILGDRLGLTRLEIAKFGQSAEGSQVILKALTEGLQESFGGASAARANNLSQAFSNFQDILEATFDTIGQSGFNQALSEAIRSLSQFIEKNQDLVISIGQGLGNAIKIITDNAKILISVLSAAFGAIIAQRLVAFATGLYEIAKALRAAAVAGTIFQAVTGIGIVKALAGIAGAAGAVFALEKVFDDATKSAENYENKIDDIKKQLSDGPLTLPVSPGLETKNSKEALDDIKSRQRNLIEGAISYFKEYKNGVEDLQKNIQIQTELVQLTEQEATIQKELNQFTKNYFDTIRPLQQQVIELKAKDTEESKIQGAEIERQIGLITNLYTQSKQALTDQLIVRERITKEMEKQKELENALLQIGKDRRDFEEDLANTITKYKRELEDLSLTGPEKQLKDIERIIGDNLVNAIKNVKNQWEDGIITSDEYINEIIRLEKIAKNAQDEIANTVRKQQEYQTSWSFGWSKAIRDYVDDATNGAKAAERIFKTTTQGMEDAIMNFARTGKFEFKSFMNSILEELLRSQVRQLIGQIFNIGGSRGTGGFFSSVGKLLGFANGGIIPTNSPVLVGERGPELISGAAGRNVTPNEQLGLGTTNVIYNISAVDARSFKELVASDPSFIYAVTEQGRRTLPSSRR